MSDPKIRVTFLTPELPWPADQGGKLRTYHLLRALSAVAEIDLYTLSRGSHPATDALSEICQNVTIVPVLKKQDWRTRIGDLMSPQPRSIQFLHTTASCTKLQEMMDQSPYDLLVCDEIGMVPYASASRSWGSNTPKIIIRQKIDFLHYREMANARYMGIKKALDWLEARRLQRYEQSWMSAFDAAVVCSREDEHYARLEGARTVRIVENGADFEYFQTARRPSAQPTVLLLGTMHYYPNVDMVLHFFNTIYGALRERFADLRVLIVGHDPPPEVRQLAQHPGVIVTGSVPDVRPYLAESWLLAVPLRLGGGTRLKIIEAMASKLPVVSTPIGAQGLAVEDSRHLLLAEEPTLFADQVEALLDAPQERDRLADSAYKFAREQYSWQRLGQRFASICQQTVQSSRL